LERELDRLMPLMNSGGGRDQGFLQMRWRAQTLRMKKKLQGNKQGFTIFRAISAVGAVIVPALVGLDLTGGAAVWSRWVAFGLSVLVAVTTTLLGVFRYGPRWTLYERSVDAMIGEAWQYVEGGRDYVRVDASKRFALFMERIETILARYAEGYMHDVVLAGTESRDEPSPGKATGSSGGKST
jgi:hypothetical protein